MTTKIKSTNTDFGSETDSIVIPKGSTNERTSVVAGSLRFNTTTLALEIYDGTNWSGLASSPNITSISPTNVDSKDSSTTTTFTITGSGFAIGTTAKLISNSGTDINFNTVTRDSTTQLTCVLNNALITGDGLTDEPYDIKVTSGNNLSFTLENQINVDQRPVFVTASGSLGTMTEGARATTIYTIEATDPESAGAVRYDVVGGSLPTGATLNSSTGAISGFSAVGGDTTSNFTIQASDVDSNVSFRSFSITVLAPVVQSFTTSGTFSVPSGVTAVDVLVVAGGGGGGAGASGGGGAGGLIFRPAFPVTPGGTVTVTVGCGGTAAAIHWPGPNTGGSGQDSVFGTLTAKGGGYGSGDTGGAQGGSGGSSGYSGKGQGIQPTQPGDSGTYGFGNPGGCGSGIGASIFAGGGGGAGAAASPVPLPGSPSGSAGNGGIGKEYSISGTAVYYAGGGGGGFYRPGGTPGQGGQGGGGSSGPYGGPAQAGTANRGGGGGGGSGGGSNSGLTPGSGGVGGKGIVIVAY